MNPHPSPAVGRSQAEKILAELRRNAGHWVAMTDLWQVSGAFAVHSRCAQLRREGHMIDNRSERKGGKVHSFYRLVEKQEAA